MLAQFDDDSNQSNISALVDQWIDQGRKGNQFPVPFDLAWQFAGYSNKANAKQSGLKGLKKDKHFSSQIMKNGRAGRSSDLIMLSLDAFKHLCLMANTDEGEQVRDYFIDAQEKWELLKQTRPDVAEEIEILKWKAEISRNEAIRSQSEQKVIELRHYVATSLPKVIGDRILGVTEIKETEIVKHVIKDDQLINDGSTINKTALCERYEILTKNGKPDFKKLNDILANAKLPESAFDDTMTIRTNKELKREYLVELDRIILVEQSRQMYLGE